MKDQRILILSSHRGNRHQLELLLGKAFQVVTAGPESLPDLTFDLAILDLSALQALRKDIRQRRAAEAPVLLPFLLFSPRANAAAAARHLGGEVDELILTPIEKHELQGRVGNMVRLRRMSLDLKQQLETVDQLSITDDVSGFHNTRFLHRFLDQLLAQSDVVLSLVFTDMDRFKSVVDTHGHLLGAKVLREAAEVFDRHLGPEDRIVRYGGDEYVIILPNQGKQQALAKIEKLRQGLVAEKFLKAEKLNLQITASMGLATYPEDARDKRQLLAAADQCLFQSKEKGKDRVTAFGD